MFFLLPAVFAHLGNALVFVIDKGILGAGSAISNPAKYAAYSGLVAAGAAVLFIISPAAPTVFILTWSFAAGILWIAALWFFFIALKGGEPSRVVPLIGSAVPLFTLLFAAVFLGERLGSKELAAVVLLMSGGVLLAIRFSSVRALPGVVSGAAVLGGAAFAAHFALVKFMYERFDPFLAAFSYTRLGVGLAALLLLVALLIMGPRKKRKRSVSARQKKRSTGVAVAFFSSKTLGMAALLLQNYAIDLGSVTVVNALQGTQYLFVLLLAAAVSRWFPKFFREELHRVALAQKLAGITAVSLGLIILVV